MSVSAIAYYLPSRITSGLLRQETSATYKSLRNIYLGVLEDNQEQNVQSSDNNHRGLGAGRVCPRTVTAANTQQMSPALGAGSTDQYSPNDTAAELT